MMDKKYYVLGFLFDNLRRRVALIKKRRPQWQSDSFNGIGGEMEDDENAITAMDREFKEEADVSGIDWEEYDKIEGKDYVVFCFRAFDTGAMSQICTMTDEVVSIHHVHKLPEMVISNVPDLIRVALNSKA